MQVLIRFSAVSLGVALLTALWAPNASAYSNYAPNCEGCHGAFATGDYTSEKDGWEWGVDLMTGHQNFLDVQGSNCDTCHTQQGDNPSLFMSGDSVRSQGCAGCHGRDEDNTANDGAFGGPNPGRSDGLRAHHAANGVTVCGGCHNADTVPVGEDVEPFNYLPAAGITGLDDACADAQFGPTGLDNDGDDLDDGADTDCTPPIPTPGDFDFDGMADIMWRHAVTGEVYFWQMNGPEITSSSSVTTPSTPNWEIVGTGDYNGDNKADIMWRNSVSRQVYYWQMDGAEITSSSSIATLAVDNWQVIGSGDYDGDGNADLMWRHVGVGGSGEIYYWRMDGPTILSSARVAFLADLDWNAVGSGDYDGDGNADLMWRHDLTGLVYYWRMNGSTIMSSAKVAQPSDLNWRVVGNGDYNGDGMDDLMWRNIGVGGSGKVYYWQMNGSTITSSSRVSIVSDLNWTVVGDGDYDGDGNADMLWLHGTNGQIYYWQQDGATTVDPSSVSTLSDLNWEVVYSE